MFSLAASDAFTPKLKTGALHMLAHERDYARFVDAELNLDGLKRRAVFPRHLHDAVNRCDIQRDNLLFHIDIISDDAQFAGAETI